MLIVCGTFGLDCISPPSVLRWCTQPVPFAARARPNYLHEKRVERRTAVFRMGEGGTSLLETPPFVIAVVFLFFLVVTLGFEKVR